MHLPLVYFKITIVHTSHSKDLEISQLSVLVQWLVVRILKVPFLSLTQHLGYRIPYCSIGNHIDDFGA